MGYLISLDRPLTPDETATVGDGLAATPEQFVESHLLHGELDSARSRLSARERAVVTARVGWCCPRRSEQDIAGEYGVSVEQVRATTASALLRLRAVLAEQGRQDAA